MSLKNSLSNTRFLPLFLLTDEPQLPRTQNKVRMCQKQVSLKSLKCGPKFDPKTQIPLACGPPWGRPQQGTRPNLSFTPLLTSSIPRGCPGLAQEERGPGGNLFFRSSIFLGGRTQTRALSTIATATGQRQRPPRPRAAPPAALHPPGTKASMPYFFWSERRSGCPPARWTGWSWGRSLWRRSGRSR